jgi:teichuronic acid biosynthesis glycosyltransferase TuaH
VKSKNRFLVLAANTPWLCHLGNALADEFTTEIVQIFDFLNFIRSRPEWPEGLNGRHLGKSRIVLPSGFAGSLSRVLQPAISRKVFKFLRSEYPRDLATNNWVIVPYPWLLPSVRKIPGESLVYYNLDDYTLYRPQRAKRILDQENELIQKARFTVCISRYQRKRLSKRLPGQSSRIFYLPLGVAEAFINQHPNVIPDQPRVGYIGNLSERVDWKFVYEVATQCPTLQFVFVGSIAVQEEDKGTDWYKFRTRVAELSNTEFTGYVSQDSVGEIYGNFAINWIPYDVEHPFNIASCPTKIMDSLASGRPVISTDIPECRAYEEWVKIIKTPHQAVSLLSNMIETESTDARRAEDQVRFVSHFTWAKQAERFCEILGEKGFIS